MKKLYALIAIICPFIALAQEPVLGPPPPPCDHMPIITPGSIILCPNTSDTLWTQHYDTLQWYKDGMPILNATDSFYVVDAFADGGSTFTVSATLNNCTQISEPVLVDGWVFLLPSVITEGNIDTICVGDTLLLIMGLPYTTNIQWTRNGLDIEGATDDTLVVTTSGGYSVSGAPAQCPNYIQDLGLTLTYNFLNCETGLTEDAVEDIAVYPNPATDRLTLSIEKYQHYKNYTLLDYTGRMVLSGNINANITTIDLGTLPQGIYMLQIIGKNAKWNKIVKQ